MIEGVDDIINVEERWESLGLLDGIPILQKTELAQIYDNATKLMLSDISIKKIPKEISELVENFYIPICRRLYKRVGPNFNLEFMMGQLLEVVDKKRKTILEFDPEKPANNPIVDFCIDFADGYEDDLTKKTSLTDSEYEEKINNVLDITQSVLLNKSLVSYVNNVGGSYKIESSIAKKNPQQRRFWNQSVAKNFLESALSEINKGL